MIGEIIMLNVILGITVKALSINDGGCCHCLGQCVLLPDVNKNATGGCIVI